MPAEWLEINQLNPSALRALELELNLQDEPSSSSLIIKWSINIDSSIHYITGTWIELQIRSHLKPEVVKYRCDYNPPFTKSASQYTGLDELSFSFIADVPIKPNDVFKAIVYNLPLLSIDMSGEQLKIKEIQAPGCDAEQMKSHLSCDNQYLEFDALREGNKIVVTFRSSSDSKEYNIELVREYTTINRARVVTDREVKSYTEELSFFGPCENLKLQIKPHTTSCGAVCDWEESDIDCTTQEPTPKLKSQPVQQAKSTLLISTGCTVAIAVLLMLFCFCHFYRLRKHRLTSTEPVSVLLVYPAVESVFQQAVMALADFLQSHNDLNVAIDMWQRVSLAEQGPLRWLNSQADQADKVLIILPPQHTDTEFQKLAMAPGKPDFTVPASAHELYSLALNLIASSAHDSQWHHKFWLVQLGKCGEQSTVPVELRGCKILSLPRDLKKLHQKLVSRQGEKDCMLCCRISSFHCKVTSKKVWEAVLQLERNYSDCLKEEMTHLSEVESNL